MAAMQDGTQWQALIAEYGRLSRLEGFTPQSRGQRFNELIAATLRCWGIDARSSVRAKGETDPEFDPDAVVVQAGEHAVVVGGGGPHGF
jgi:hypothetical protein